MKVLIILSVAILGCLAQRSPYAGKNPIGYPKVEPITAGVDQLGDRFGESDGSTTTIRLPIEALGDADLVRRLMKLPEDQRPFWLLNWQALEVQRKNPQIYPQRGNTFIDSNSAFQ